MNAERLYLVTSFLLNEFKKAKLRARLDGVVNAINGQVNSPSDGNLQAITQSLADLENAIAATELDDLPSTWSRLIEEIGLADIVQPNLAAVIREIIRAKQPMLNEARDEIQRLVDITARAEGSFDEIDSAFKKLAIPKEELEPGEAELSVIFPREIFSNKLDQFLGEVKLIDRLIKQSSAVASGAAETPSIRQISSSDPTFFLTASAATVLFVLQVVNMILDARTKALNLRKLRVEAEAAGAEPDIVQRITDQATALIVGHVRKFFEAVRADKPTNPLREQEISHLETTALQVAARIDNGMRIDGAVEVPPQPANADGPEQSDPEIVKLQEIQKVAERIRYTPIEGPPVLGLPKPKADDGDAQADVNRG